jgi:5-methyltetrahydropteroyltriglutamate--homocysteine methyltransferase
MKRSDRRILTSHVGSLPRPDALIEINRAKFAGEAYDAGAYAATLSAAVEEVCRKQAEIGIDVINDGEFGKTTSGPIDYGAWSSYAWGRLSGWEPGEPGRLPALAGRRDRLKFAEFYRELDATSFRSSRKLSPPSARRSRNWHATVSHCDGQ